MSRPPSRWTQTGAVLEERALRPTVTPNGNPDVPPSSVGEDVDNPGDPHGVEITGSDGPWRATHISPSPWSGWPGTWATPPFAGGRFGARLEELSDTAWAALDLNASILSTMPPYRMRGDELMPATTWMGNPDPDLYTSWEEFDKQLAWDFQMGEAFVLPTVWSEGYPARFHVVPPWLVNVEMDSGLRRYNIGSLDVTDEILHIRYKSTTDNARGIGPLDVGRHRLIAAAVLTRYVTTLVEGGGVPHYILKHPGQLTATQADALLHGWWESRMSHLGLPAIASGGLEVETLQMNPKDMALLDLAQFNESRIAVLLGVPPFLLGLPSGGDSMTYSNVSALFDYHWRAGLRPKARPLMAAMSGWALPRGQRIEVNSDEYTRPGFGERVSAWATLHGIEDDTGRAVSAADIRRAERLNGDQATAILTGGI